MVNASSEVTARWMGRRRLGKSSSRSRWRRRRPCPGPCARRLRGRRWRRRSPPRPGRCRRRAREGVPRVEIALGRVQEAPRPADLGARRGAGEPAVRLQARHRVRDGALVRRARARAATGHAAEAGDEQRLVGTRRRGRRRGGRRWRRVRGGGERRAGGHATRAGAGDAARRARGGEPRRARRRGGGHRAGGGECRSETDGDSRIASSVSTGG